MESEQRKEAELKKLAKEIEKEEKEGQKELKKLGKKRFGCEADARESLKEVNKNLRYHQAIEVEVVEKKKYVEPGRPRKDTAYQKVYEVSAKLEQRREVIEVEEKRRGKFVLATNELEVEKLSSEGVLNTYKGATDSRKGVQVFKRSFVFHFECISEDTKEDSSIGNDNGVMFVGL